MSYERTGWVEDEPARLTGRLEVRPAAELGPIIVCLDTSGAWGTGFWLAWLGGAQVQGQPDCCCGRKVPCCMATLQRACTCRAVLPASAAHVCAVRQTNV